MKVLDVRMRQDAGQITLSARCKVRRFGLDVLSFTVPGRFAEFIVADAVLSLPRSSCLP
jgi:hypothetical protein